MGAKLGRRRWSSHVTDPIADALGDYRAFFAGQKDRLRARGIDISPYPLSHLAYRVPERPRHAVADRARTTDRTAVRVLRAGVASLEMGLFGVSTALVRQAALRFQARVGGLRSRCVI